MGSGRGKGDLISTVFRNSGCIFFFNLLTNLKKKLCMSGFRELKNRKKKKNRPSPQY